VANFIPTPVLSGSGSMGVISVCCTQTPLKDFECKDNGFQKNQKIFQKKIQFYLPVRKISFETKLIVELFSNLFDCEQEIIVILYKNSKDEIFQHSRRRS